MGSFTVRSSHPARINYGKANNMGLVGQQRANDVTQQLQTKLFEKDSECT